MPEIVLKNITKRWGRFFGVDNVSLDIPDNSFITLLGPSGCGKTTILRMIAGLETPTEGQIKIGDRVVFDSNAGINIPPNKRSVGFLFQNYALWPNMTVYQNIAFGLKNINEEMPKIDVEAKQTGDMVRALQNGAKIREIVEECRDKNGKLDDNKACVKLIDNYSLSMMTAKALYGLKIHEASDPVAAAKTKLAEYEAKFRTLQDKYRSSGQELNEKYEICSGGKPVMEKRKLTNEEIDSRVRACSRIVKIGMSWTVIPQSSPAANSSVSLSPGRSLRNRRYFSWMSPCPTWMPSSVWRCATNCSVCTSRPAAPLFTLRTTRWKP